VLFNINDLRQEKRQWRASLEAQALERSAETLCERIIVLEAYKNANRIAAYFAVNGEISLSPVIDHALENGKEVYLPNLDQKSLRFSPYFHEQKMRINKFRLPEPDVSDEKMLMPEQLDLVLAPLVVFDADRNRIGMGGGFYDRSFEFRKDKTRLKPILIGVAHEGQKVDKLVPQYWDVRLDKVATDINLYE
jgi:5-formyltetrahydrofolate cyclo-ligase